MVVARFGVEKYGWKSGDVPRVCRTSARAARGQTRGNLPAIGRERVKSVWRVWRTGRFASFPPLDALRPLGARTITILNYHTALLCSSSRANNAHRSAPHARRPNRHPCPTYDGSKSAGRGFHARHWRHPNSPVCFESLQCRADPSGGQGGERSLHLVRGSVKIREGTPRWNGCRSAF